MSAAACKRWPHDRRADSRRIVRVRNRLSVSATRPSVFTKLPASRRMTRRIWRGEFDALIAYQSTASILAGVVGCAARLPACASFTKPARRTRPRAAAAARQVGRLARALHRQHRQQRRHLGRLRGLSGALSARDDLIEHGLDAPAPARGRDRSAPALRPAAAQPLLLNVGRLARRRTRKCSSARWPACRKRIWLSPAAAQGDACRALAGPLGVADRCICSVRCRPATSPISTRPPTCSCFRRPGRPSDWPPSRPRWRHADGGGRSCGAARSVADEGAEPVAFVAPHDTEGWCLRHPQGVRGAARTGGRCRIRARHAPEIFAPAHDRKLSDAVR